ncbi:MAG: hypothetical protein JO263_10465, partial [Candidatus Eremiobacteraeota bacterium]|nr:hypothetical protein [Candidatus Eremiobacteraeota bacterium]
LGAPGNALREDELGDFDVARYFRPVYPRLLRFTGPHPDAALQTLARLSPALSEHHRLTAKIAARQPVAVKLSNIVRKANYEMRWRFRATNPVARRISTP